jgi:hypothetical protein
MRKELTLEQALESCLGELVRPDAVEACLRRYPQHAEQLRPLLELAQASQGLYAVVPEPPGALVAGRERMLAAARQRAEATQSAPATTTALPRRHEVPQRRRVGFALALRFVTAMLLIVVGMGILGGGAIWAASDSLPGELLYPVKLAIEDARLQLASTPQHQVDLALDFVEERAQELETLVTTGRPVSEAAVARLEEHVGQALDHAARASDQEMDALLTEIAERTHGQQQVLEQVKTTAPESAQTGLGQAAMVCQRGAQVAEDGLGDPQAFRKHYRRLLEAPEPEDEPRRATATPLEDSQQGQGPQGGQDLQQGRSERYEEEAVPGSPDQEAGDSEHQITPNNTPTATPRALMPTATPQVTPTAPRVTRTASPKPGRPPATATPPPILESPQETATPKATSAPPTATDTQRDTGLPTQAPGTPPATPQGPGTTPEQPAKTSQPRPPDDGSSNGN